MRSPFAARSPTGDDYGHTAASRAPLPLLSVSSAVTTASLRARADEPLPSHRGPFRYVTDLLNTATPALCSGAIQAVLFNPFDRALYVRVQHKRRRFLDRRNFEAPFQGFANAAVYRTISSASYIFWQDTCRYFLDEIGGGPGNNTFTPTNYPILYSAVVGILAGAANGLALNNMQAVKFTMWSQSSQVVSHWETARTEELLKSQKLKAREISLASVKSASAGVSPETALGSSSSTVSSSLRSGGSASLSSAASKGFFATARDMYHVGGPRVFFRGVKVTMLRDTIFGLVYELLRKSTTIRRVLEVSADRMRRISGAATDAQRKRPKDDQSGLAFIQNIFAACCGCAASSPINYLRSLAYGTPIGAHVLPIPTLFGLLVKEVRYVFEHGHTYMDCVKGRPTHGLDFNEISRVEHARKRLGFRTMYTEGEGKSLADEAARNVSAISRRFDEYTNRDPTRSFYPAKRRHFWAAAVHLNRRFNVGWGSLRVGLGMAVGQHVFALVKEAMTVI